MNEFLKGLELDTETVDTIMAEYGKRVNGLREENQSLKNQANNDKDSEEIINSLTAERDDYKSKYETEVMKTKGFSISNAGIDDKFKDFVMSEVNKNVDDTTDFDTALKSYIEKNPQYKKIENARKVNSSFSISGPNKEASSNSTFNNAILGALGRK